MILIIDVISYQEHVIMILNLKLHIQVVKQYIPIKKDLTDLISKIDWCRSHPQECKNICHNALVIYSTLLSRDGVLNYVSDVLKELSHRRSFIQTNYITPLEILRIREKKYITNINKPFHFKNLQDFKKSNNSIIKHNYHVLTKEINCVCKNSENEFIHDIFVSYILKNLGLFLYN